MTSKDLMAEFNITIYALTLKVVHLLYANVSPLTLVYMSLCLIMDILFHYLSGFAMDKITPLQYKVQHASKFCIVYKAKKRRMQRYFERTE